MLRDLKRRDKNMISSKLWAGALVALLVLSGFGIALAETGEMDVEVIREGMTEGNQSKEEITNDEDRDRSRTLESDWIEYEREPALKSNEDFELTASYTEHEPIQINNDTELNQTALDEGWNGTGSEEDPYIIEGYDIDGDDYGYALYIGNTTDHFVVRDCYLHDADDSDSNDYWEEAGLQLYNITNGSIKNNDVSSNDLYGLYLEESNDITIFNNTVSSNYYEDGIYFTNSDNNIVENNTVSSNGDYGLYFRYSIGNILRNNTVSDNGYAGVDLYYSDGTILENNTVSSNSNQGIYLYSSDDTVLENNTVSDNSDYGISLRYSEGIILKNTVLTNDGILIEGSSQSYWTTLDIDLTNTVNGKPVRLWKNRTSGTVPTDTGQVILANCTGVTIEDQNIDYSSVGILLGHSTNITLNNNSVSNNDDGIYLHYSDNNTLENNTADSNRKGVYIGNTYNTLVENNSFTSNTDDGIYITSSGNNMIKNNSFSSNSNGIYLSYSDSNTFVNNTISSSGSNGIEFYDSNSNILQNNTVSYSAQDGIYIRDSKSNTLKNITMIDDGVLLSGTNVEYWNTHDIDTSNTVNGRPVRYWKNRTGGDMPANTGQVILANCTGITVENKRYDNSSIGILLGHSDNNDLMNNTLYSNDDGIYLYYSEDNLVKNNTAGSNRKGIYMDDSHFNTLIDNSLFSNEDSGMRLSSSNNNEIENNTVSPDNQIGIYLRYSESNTLTNNEISSNNYQGIYFYRSSSNRIENNTLSSNGDEGLYLYSSSNDNIIKNNDISSNDNNGIHFYSSDSNDIENNNISSNNYRGIYSRYSNNNIENNTIESNGDEGIYFYSSDSNTVKNNSVSSNNQEGIYFSSSTGNDIENNTIEFNDYEGIEFYSSDSNTLKYNTITANTDEGIYISRSDNNDIENNTVSLNDYGGITLSDSSFNILKNNTVLDNLDTGISLHTSTDNTTIYHNNIIDNVNQAVDDGENNTWYSSVLKEGNYWSDYTGTDEDDDGVGETNYTKIDGSAGSNDTYPLVYAVDDDEPPTIDADNSPSNGTAGADYTFNITASDDINVESVNVTWSHDSSSGNLPLNYNGFWTGTITLDMSADDLTYKIQVNDSAGNYVRSGEKNISVKIDTDGPTINDTTSGTPSTGDTFNVTAEIDDYSTIDSAWLEYTLTSAEGYSSTYNESMDHDSDYWYELSLWDNATDLDYTIAANDTVDNWNTSSNSYQVNDNDGPSMTDKSANIGYVLSEFNFKVNVMDNIGVDSVNVTWEHGSLSGNRPLSDSDNDHIWNGSIVLDDNSTDDLTYRIQANDTSGNQAVSTERTVNVIESDKPIRIDNDDELAAEALSGNGTEADPYVIEGYDIDGVGSGYCIYIGNTTDHFVVRNNTLYNASGNGYQYFRNSGLYLYNVTNGSAEDNNFSDNYENGIILESSSNNTIEDNNVSTSQNGILLESSSNNTIEDNNVSTSQNGILLESSSNNTLLKNNVSSNTVGIRLIDLSSDNLIDANNASANSDTGISIDTSNRNLVENNTASRNYYQGIYVQNAVNNTIDNNTISRNNYYGILIRSSSDNTIIENNTISQSNYGIYIDSSSNNTIEDNNVSQSNNGLFIRASSKNDVRNNFVNESNYGIYLYYADNNLIKGNNASKNNLGFLLRYSNDNTIINNTALGNQYGIGFSGAYYNNIESNDFSNNTYGIHAYSCINNTFLKNTIDSNSNTGITLSSSTENNLIYHNDILNNTQQAVDDGTGNQWYNSTLEEGNYWSDYNGTDQDGDGVGETNYTNIGGSAGSNDTYPLTIPNNDNEPPTLVADNSPDSGTTGDAYTFNITASDYYEIGSVNVSWTHGSKSGNLALIYDGNGTWIGTITLDHSLNDMIYRVQVNDTTGNYVRGSQQAVSVSDNDDPSIISDDSDNSGTTDDPYEFNFTASDNIEVESVNVTWSHGSLNGNKQLSIQGGYWVGTITLDDSLDDLTYRVQVNDTSGNYVIGVQQTVQVFDNDAPNINDTTSGVPSTGDLFNVTAEVSDNMGVDTVWIEYTLTSAEGYGHTYNRSMNNSSHYWFELQVWNNATQLNYSIQANDTADNWNSVLNETLVEDNDAPSLDIDNSPDNGTTGDSYTFNITASDNIEVGSVNVNWSHGASSGNLVLTDDSDGSWSGTITLDDSLDYLIYRIQVNDTSGNSVSGEEQTVSVIDNDAPSFMDDSPDSGTTGDSYSFDINATDNIAVESVNVTWSHGVLSSNLALTEDSDGTWSGSIFTDDSLDNMTYKVQVNDTSGNFVRGSEQYVVISDNDSPTADPGDDKTVDEDVAVTFDGSASSDNIGVTNYIWNIEGTEYEGQTVEHTFDQPGEYTVMLNVTDEAGNHDIAAITVTVTDVTDPMADAGSDINVTLNESFTLDGSASSDNVGIVNYTWVIDGEKYFGAEIDHSFSEIGTYVFTLNVTDEAGNFDTDTVNVTVEDRTTPEAVIEVSTETAALQEEVSFDGSNSSDNHEIANFTWIIEDMEYHSVEVIHAFSETGSYEVSLNVTDSSGNFDLETVTITVEDQTSPVAVAATNKTAVKTGESISFDASDSTDNVNITSYSWQFGDGSTATGATVIHSYGSEGDYTVELTVTDEAGNTDTDTLNITVEKKDTESPVAEAGEDKSVYVDEEFELDASASSDNIGIVNYTWVIEGVEFYGEQLTHSFASEGTYDITLKVSDAVGNKDSDTVTITVEKEDQDSDGDGIPDEWEEKHGLDPNDPYDAEEDMDNDGYTNLEEYEKGTDPKDSESYPAEEKTGSDLRAYLALIIFVVILVLLMLTQRNRGQGKDAEGSKGKEAEESGNEETEKGKR